MQAKKRATAAEIAKMIEPHLTEFPVASVGVHKSPASGDWYVIVVTHGTEAAGESHAVAKRALDALQIEYEIVEG